VVELDEEGGLEAGLEAEPTAEGFVVGELTLLWFLKIDLL